MTWNKTCLYTCFVLIFFTACTSSKKYDYFQANYNSKDKSTVLPFDVATAPIHIIDIGDVIEINYYTPDEINQSIMNTSDESEKKTKINLFTVNSEGYIEIPLIGTCKVLGCNIDDVKDTVTNRISKYFNSGCCNGNLGISIIRYAACVYYSCIARQITTECR